MADPAGEADSGALRLDFDLIQTSESLDESALLSQWFDAQCSGPTARRSPPIADCWRIANLMPCSH